jgi:hypothetical protein
LAKQSLAKLFETGENDVAIDIRHDKNIFINEL